MWKSSKTFANSTIETQQVYSTSLPINIFEGSNANTAIKGLRDHNSESKGMLQCQLVKEVISVNHIPLNKGKPQGKYAVNILSGQQEYLPYNMKHMSIPHSRVLYGTGKGEVVLSQPPPLTDYPLVPEAPPPPSDCLIQLTSPKAPSAPRVASSIDLKMPPEFISTSESLEYFELQPDLNSQSKDQVIPPHLYSSTISLGSQSCESVVDHIDSTLAAQPQQYSTCQPIKSFPQSLKSTKSSPVSPSKSRSVCELLPQNKAPNTLGSSSAQLPRSSKVPYHFVSISASSSPKTQISFNLSESSKRLVRHLTKLIEAQLRSSMTNPPQSKLCFTSTKVTTPQSSSSLTSSISSHRALAISQDATVPPYIDVKQNSPSILPTMSKSRKALMEVIRNGVQLRKTREIIPGHETEW
ncbi:hypothetical protein A6R68_08044 [Neotoma lepida]|uniref:WH2 domain-containing protein n=1 Tax=Neotoma lepida TaxID=56216 RepID=A0A1A6GDK3_NEOLE|nr:hypothetical protein A6R68_08044 [Neotoma lepida]